jgi:hypothetical protein
MQDPMMQYAIANECAGSTIGRKSYIISPMEITKPRQITNRFILEMTMIMEGYKNIVLNPSNFLINIQLWTTWIVGRKAIYMPLDSLS